MSHWVGHNALPSFTARQELRAPITPSPCLRGVRHQQLSTDLAADHIIRLRLEPDLTSQRLGWAEREALNPPSSRTLSSIASTVNDPDVMRICEPREQLTAAGGGLRTHMRRQAAPSAARGCLAPASAPERPCITQSRIWCSFKPSTGVRTAAAVSPEFAAPHLRNPIDIRLCQLPDIRYLGAFSSRVPEVLESDTYISSQQRGGGLPSFCVSCLPLQGNSYAMSQSGKPTEGKLRPARF